MRRIPDKKQNGRSRLPSLAGKGLPERIRSTAFAFLGLTAAAGLATVALFAQLGFPLLSPAPLPSPPSGRDAVAEAVPLEDRPAAVGVAQAQRPATAPAGPERGESAGRTRPEGNEPRVDSPSVPVSTSPSDGAGAGDPAGSPEASPAPTPAPEPVPTTTPQPAPEPEAVPAPAPPAAPEAKPAKTEPSKPVAKPAKTAPDKAKPAKSEPKPDKAKPAKVDAKPDKAEPQPTPEPSYAPAPPPPPEPVDQAKEKDKKEKKDK